MKILSKFPVLHAGITSLILLCSFVFAGERVSSQQVLDMVERGEILSIVEILQRHSELRNIHWLDIELEREDGEWVYEFKIIDSTGHVLKYTLNAVDGSLIEKDQQDD